MQEYQWCQTDQPFKLFKEGYIVKSGLDLVYCKLHIDRATGSRSWKPLKPEDLPQASAVDFGTPEEQFTHYTQVRPPQDRK